MMTIDEAQKQIAEILRQVEVGSGALVKGVRIRDVDITRLADPRRQISRAVEIELEHIPGTHWET
jgi:hypothetical protein